MSEQEPAQEVAPERSAASGGFAMRCHVMGIVWAALGLGLVYYGYHDRLILIDQGRLDVQLNDEAMWAGYAAIAFGVVWIAVGIVSSLRHSRTSAP